MRSVVVIGGGISGLLTAIQLAKSDIPCTIVEKKIYPFHRVCGEYISNEAVPFLKSYGLFPDEFNPPIITRFQLSAISGKNEVVPLDLGGFGISRYTFDNFLYTQATKLGVKFFLKEEVEDVMLQDEYFQIKTQARSLQADLVVGAFGKRSKIDLQINRPFTQKRSPYVGIKYHIQRGHPDDLISLHNFNGGYCGISNIEDGKTNLCYLTHRNNLRQFKNIRDMEEAVLFKNPFLKEIFQSSHFLFDKPETINEILFETKSPVENHILITGDAAGMIAPLCGNGMAMAIHGSKILSEHIINHFTKKKFNRNDLEREYATAWRSLFQRRLWFGRQVQKLFGSDMASNLSVNLAIRIRPLANLIIKGTHGKPF